MTLPTVKLTTSAGLVTEPGDFSRAEGSLVAAGNVDLSAPGIIAKRRGFKSEALASFSGAIYSLHSSPALELYSGPASVLMETGTPGAAASSGLRYGQRDGLISAISGTLENILERRGKLVTGPDGVDVLTSFGGSEQGPVALDYVTPEWRRLGIPRGMGLDRQNTTTPAGTMLTTGYSVRYAVVFALGDPMTNGAQFGAPGMTSVVSNTSGATADVATRVLLPVLFGDRAKALPADTYWMQVYRSAQTLTTTGEPPSELALVYQQQISAEDIAAGYIAFTDSTPDSLRGANLYTNLLTGEDGFAGRGFLNSNEPPPVGSDVTTFADCLWLSELQEWPSQEVQLISVGGTGLVAGDTVTVAGTVYTGVAAAPAANQFVVSGGGAPSVNQRETALNIVDAINRSAANASVYAYYVAGQAGLPGRIIIRTRTTALFIGFATSRAAAFRIGTETSDAELNGLAFSKPLQPAAWPVVNRFKLGRGEAPILRIIPYRDSLFVFKTDGLWRVTGRDYATFTASEFDLTFRLAAREACVAADDAIYAWGEQGIARITDGGVEYIDLPIRSQVVQRQASSARFATFAFAVARQFDGVVTFWAPRTNGTGSTNLACNAAFVWHARTQRWSTWTTTAGTVDFSSPDDEIGYACGVSNVADSKLTMGVWQLAPATGAWLHNELRDFATTDYNDPDMTDPTDPTMAEAAIEAGVAWGPVGSPLEGGVQWVKARATCLMGSTVDYRTLPSTLNFDFYSAQTNNFPWAAGAPSVSMGSGYRIPGVFVAPVPQNASRSYTVFFSITNDTASEGFWLTGAALDYRPLDPRGAGR